MESKNEEQYEQFETEENVIENKTKSHRLLIYKKISPFIAITICLFLILFFYSSFSFNLNFIQKTNINNNAQTNEKLTIELRIQYKAEPGENMYIYGDTDLFGNWTEQKFKLFWHEGDIWSKRILLPISDDLYQFKFVLQTKSGQIWEDGNNRILTTKNLAGFDRTKFDIYILDCVWNYYEINFNVHYILKDPNSYLQIIGGKSLNDIKGSNDNIIMNYDRYKTIKKNGADSETGFWTASIFVKNTNNTNITFDYQYSIYNSQTHETKVEKKNNNISLVLSANNTEIPENLLIDSYFQIVDNFTEDLLK